MEPTLAERLQALAQEVEEDVEGAPWRNDGALKMVADLREASALLLGLEDLLALILEEMPAATNRDLATDGGVGDEEGLVWNKIDEAAQRLLERRQEADAEPELEPEATS